MNKQDVEKIITLYQEGNSMRTISEHMQCSEYAVQKVLKESNITIRSKKRTNYTPEDIEFIKKHYPQGDWEAIKNRFGENCRNNIHYMASKLKIKSESFWDKNDEQILIDNMYEKTWAEIQPMLNSKRTLSSIQTHAFVLGYAPEHYWTKADEEFFCKNYSSMSVDEIHSYYPNRSRSSIIDYASKLGLRNKDNQKWNASEIDFLYCNWHIYTDEQISAALNRRIPASIKAKRLELGLYRGIPNHSTYNPGLKNSFRRCTYEWKNEVMDSADHRCFLTGDSEIDVHHIVSFDECIESFLNTNKVPNKLLSEFDNSYLEDLYNRFKVYHDNNAKGVCMSVKLHSLFHSLYGYKNFTEYDFHTFINNYKENKLLIA